MYGVIPTLAIIGVGRDRTVPIPIPIFLLWPLVLLLLALLALGGIVQKLAMRENTVWRATAAMWRLFCSLSGFRIDVRPESGRGVYIRLI